MSVGDSLMFQKGLLHLTSICDFFSFLKNWLEGSSPSISPKGDVNVE